MKYIFILLVLFNMEIFANESKINVMCYLQSVQQENKPAITFTKRQILAKQSESGGNGIFEVTYDKYKAVLKQPNGGTMNFTYFQTIGSENKIDLYENDTNKNILCGLSPKHPNMMVLYFGRDGKSQVFHQCEPKK